MHADIKAFENTSANNLSCSTKSSVHNTRCFVLTYEMQPKNWSPALRGIAATESAPIRVR